jgi:hypothetical protein
MDVIGFQCVSLGSSTVQLHDSVRSRRACACSDWSKWRPFEGYPTEEQCSVVRILWPKGLNAKDIHKDIIPVYGGKCMSRKAGKSFADDEEVETEVRKWLRRRPKDF